MKKYSKYLIILVFIVTALISICFIPVRASKLIPLVEEHVEKDLGIKIHIERLIFRLGPSLKLKAPIMHLMYEDGQKFAQFDNVKFYVSWSSLLKNTPRINKINAKKLSIRVISDDKYILPLLNKIQSKDFKEQPNLQIKEYSLSYLNKINNERYILVGNCLQLDKNIAYKNYKLKTKGQFKINSLKYIDYDLILQPDFEFIEINPQINYISLIEQIKNLDFHSDLIADIKLYKNQEKNIQASGFINIDNISVLDKTNKNPKSFIYLTLWGDKASILSNIYTSLNKKVYIEGMVNNSKKPTLDLKVKTDEININDLYQKLKIFINFSQAKNIQTVAGTLNANFSLKGDLKKIKSTGYLKITDASIIANGLKVNKINSHLDFSNNSINIVKAVGYVNNAPIIAKGNIDNNIDIELLMNKVELKYLCPAALGVKSGITSLIANISGTFDNIIHKENFYVENFILSNDNMDLSIENLKIDTNKNNTAYINNINCKTKEAEQIKIPSMKLLIDGNCIKIPDTDIFMPNSKLTANGNVFNFGNNNFSFATKLSGFINSKDLTRFANYSTRYPLLLNINGNKTSQNIISQILFEKTDILDEPAILNLVSKLEKNNLKIEDLSLVSFSGKLTNDYKSNIKGAKKLAINGTVENINEPIFKNIRLFIPQQLNIHINDTIAQIKGDLFINGKPSYPEIVGQLLIQNLFNQAMQLSLTNCTFDFNKNNVVFNAPLVKIGDSSLGANALISTDLSESILIKTINIKSKFLNTDTFLMYKDAPLTKFYPVKILDGKFYAERLLANVYGSTLYLSALSCDFELKNNIIFFKNINTELFNGKLSGNLEYNLWDEHFKTKILARGVSAEPIFSIISTRKDSISGIMDFDANIEGELISKQSLYGNIKFIVNNGRMATLGKLEHLLYAQNVIADNMLRTSLSVVTKAITLKDTGLFKYLRGDIDLKEGIATIKMLQSQGPLMSLYIKGFYNPLTDYANMVVLGRLSDEIISGLGAFGDFSLNKLMIMLTGEEQKQNILPEDFDKIPPLTSRNTKEFKSVINGMIDKPTSVKSFNWVSYTKKSLKQKEVLTDNVKLPDFVDALPY